MLAVETGSGVWAGSEFQQARSSHEMRLEAQVLDSIDLFPTFPRISSPFCFFAFFAVPFVFHSPGKKIDIFGCPNSRQATWIGLIPLLLSCGPILTRAIDLASSAQAGTDVAEASGRLLFYFYFLRDETHRGPSTWLSLGNMLHVCLLWFSGKSNHLTAKIQIFAPLPTSAKSRGTSTQRHGAWRTSV